MASKVISLTNKQQSNIMEMIADVISYRGIDVEEITEDKTLEQIGCDSIDLVEVVMKIENEFNLQISDDDVEKHFIGKSLAKIFKYLVNVLD